MPLSLIECVRNYVFHCQYEKNLSPKSIKAYAIDLNQFTCFLTSRYRDVTLEVDKIILREYLRAMSEKYKPKTVKRKIASLKAFFTYMEFDDIITVNPFRKMRIKIKEGKRLPRTIPLPNIKSIFAHLKDNKKHIRRERGQNTVVRDIAVLELLFSTGVRVGELCGLKRDDVNLVKGSVRVIGKGNKERVIPLCSPETIKALQEYDSLAVDRHTSTDHFFANRHARRLSEQSVRFMIRKYAKLLHFEEHITPHMFRHSIATLLLENGVDIRYIQHLLGHSSIMTTQIYVQVNDEAQRKVLLEKHPRRFL